MPFQNSMDHDILNTAQIMDHGAETVYGTHEDGNIVMSEKVQALAGSIYQEFERMIQRYDEEVVKTLMPLLVNVLECLDAAYQANQEQDVEVELLREDNEQLVTQYEREKSARKQAEQKLLDTEDLAEAENKELASRLESLESIARMLELKHKNGLEHASRLEEREGDLKKEYAKLHDRYTELFKTHVDYMERTKLLMSSTHSQLSSTSERIENRSRLHPVYRSSGPLSYGFVSLETSQMLGDTETVCSVDNSSDSGSGPPSLQHEFENIQTVERSAETDTLKHINQATSPHSETSPVMPTAPVGRTTTKSEKRSANTLYQELSFQDIEDNEENEVTGSWVHPGEYASSVNDNFFGMGKEVENLIMENNELLATKNALNIVKDDLIVKVDELTVEAEILREKLNAMTQSRNNVREKLSELEDELKKVKEQVKQQTHSDQEDEGDVPISQRNKFTRVEMARVLMERNQYKERFMELQEAVRWSEMMRATRTADISQRSKESIWRKFFSKLLLTSNSPHREPPGQLLRYSVATHHVVPANSSPGRLAITSGSSGSIGGSSGSNNHGSSSSNALVIAKDYSEESITNRANQRRQEQYRHVRAHVQKEDGRLHAYGWSLPGTKTNSYGGLKPDRKLLKVPAPVYCNPLAEASPHMKVFCAAGVNLNGGYTKDGGCIVGASVFYSSNNTAQISEITTPPAVSAGNGGDNNEFETLLDKQMTIAMEKSEPDSQLSSYVWICTSTKAASTVTVIDAKNPSEVLDSFPICQTNLLCICSVQGALENDYALLENSEAIKSGESMEKPADGEDDIGRVEFIVVNKQLLTEENNTHLIETILQSDPNKNVPQNDATTHETIDRNSYEHTTAVIEDIIVEPISSLHFNQQNNNNNTTTTTNHKYVTFPYSKPVNPILGSPNPLEEPIMSSIGPTIWLGSVDGMLYVHSAVARWRNCLHKVCLPDAVLSIIYVELRVVVALANGKLAIFHRQTDGQWNLSSYHLLTIGHSKHSVRCLCVVGDRIWAAHRNKIHIVDPVSFSIVHIVEAHPRKESQIRQMTATGLGVWVAIRLDSTLRLYHAHTYEHLQDVDIEPYVSKMLGTGRLGFSCTRITALIVSCNRLWIGTDNGVVISVPLTVDCISGSRNYIPKCCMANAQLSFHGHRGAVKFFVSVPEQLPADNLLHLGQRPLMLVMSGGEGYIDFRHGDLNDVWDTSTHMIVWQVSR